jgi:hypothetical protein
MKKAARPQRARRLNFADASVLLEKAGILFAVRARSGRIGLDQRKAAQLHERRFGV